jgi:collagenase-like PrtC family protease
MRRNFLFPTARQGLIASLLKKYEEINIKRFRLNGRSSRPEKEIKVVELYQIWSCHPSENMSKEKKIAFNRL